MRWAVLVMAAVTMMVGCDLRPNMPPGTRGIVSVADNDSVTLATTRSDFEDLIKAVGMKDTSGVTQIQLRGGAFNVPAGTHVLILGAAYVSSVASSHVRVLDGPRAGSTGWLFSSEIHAGP